MDVELGLDILLDTGFGLKLKPWVWQEGLPADSCGIGMDICIIIIVINIGLVSSSWRSILVEISLIILFLIRHNLNSINNPSRERYFICIVIFIIDLSWCWKQSQYNSQKLLIWCQKQSQYNNNNPVAPPVCWSGLCEEKGIKERIKVVDFANNIDVGVKFDMMCGRIKLSFNKGMPK